MSEMLSTAAEITRVQTEASAAAADSSMSSTVSEDLRKIETKVDSAPSATHDSRLSRPRSQLLRSPSPPPPLILPVDTNSKQAESPSSILAQQLQHGIGSNPYKSRPI